MTPHPISLDDLAQRSTRLARSLRAREQGSVGGPDLVALVRAEAVSSGYSSVIVPNDDGWPTALDWERASFDVDASDEELVVKPRPWLPKWADSGLPPDAAAASRQLRQRPQAVAGDPFLRRTTGGTIDLYRTVGQKEATRAVLSAAPGETVLAVLPTGSGKTLAVTVPAFMARPRLTVIIVPTVSLALDLDRRFVDQYGLTHSVAYHGGLTSYDKVAMRERLMAHEQWIVVTSPEAATTSLAPTLEKVAREGRLAHFVVDEAHMVASWGGAFRPSFQALAGLRRQLMDKAGHAGAKFTTVLLTGTLDDFGRELLGHLFSEDEVTLVAAQQTRPEPAYWTVSCSDDEQKREVLVDALRHLPRPLLVYTSLVTSERAVNASAVIGWLKREGFTRTALITGTDGSVARQAAVSALRCEGEPAMDRDVVVASSAFGLGVDIDGIRTVVHACIPESIDRYYQEVGRGGRDGRASVSLLIHSPEDLSVAEGLNASGNIGHEKSWKRWRAMRGGALRQSGALAISLTAAHTSVNYPSSDANKRWNLHTLMMMEQAGMIEIRWTPPLASDDWSDDEAEARLSEHYQTVLVDVRAGDLDDEEAFRRRLAGVRGRSSGAAARSLDTMMRLLSDGRGCFNNEFALAYRLHPPSGDVVHVDRWCGGCPACRLHRLEPTITQHSSPPYVRRSQDWCSKFPAGLIGLKAAGSVTYASKQAVPWDDIESLLARLVTATRCLLVVPPGSSAVVERLDSELMSGWFATETLSDWLRRDRPPQLPTVAILPPDAPDQTVRGTYQRASETGALLVCHSVHQAGPIESKSLLRELLTPSMSVSEALERI